MFFSLLPLGLPGGNQVDGSPPATSELTLNHALRVMQNHALRVIFKLAAGGRPSTRSPPGRLVEHDFNALSYREDFLLIPKILS